MKLALGLEVYNKAVLDLPIEAIETAERYGCLLYTSDAADE